MKSQAASAGKLRLTLLDATSQKVAVNVPVRHWADLQGRAGDPVAVSVLQSDHAGLVAFDLRPALGYDNGCGADPLPQSESFATDKLFRKNSQDHANRRFPPRNSDEFAEQKSA